MTRKILSLLLLSLALCGCAAEIPPAPALTPMATPSPTALPTPSPTPIDPAFGLAEEALALRAAGEYEQARITARRAAELSPTEENRAALAACEQPGPAFLGRTSREDYAYVIEWEPYVFDPARPLEFLRVTPMPQADRPRMERLIRLFASLYPPDYFNARVGRILCYRSFQAARLDDQDVPILDADGALIFDRIVGGMGEQHIIITDNFASDYEIVRALVHEFAHVQYAGAGHPPGALDAFDARVRALSPEGFTYYYEDETVASPADIPGWRSTDNVTDWQAGFARRYAMLSADEEHSTLMEKIQLGRMPDFAEYAILYTKMEAAAALMREQHPSLTMEFYTEDLPEYLQDVF